MTKKQDSNKKPESRITAETKKFLHAIDSLALAFSMSMKALGNADKAAHERFDKYLEDHCDASEKDGKTVYRARSHDHCHEAREIETKLDRIHAGFSAVPRSFLVALISEYDAYLGNLIKALFYLRPELLEASERSLTFAELCQFGTVDAAREYVLEKEIETLLRKSHVEQFDWLERKFDLKLRVDLPVWPSFVELTERRNLCVHNDAVVSRQYLENCRAQGVKLDEVRVGQRLKVTPAYFREGHKIIYEIGIKLGQVLWRKLVPTQVEEADGSLLDVTFSLLTEKRYAVATVLLCFADTTLQKRHADENARITFLINRALALYLDGKKEECAKVLASQDWSATRDVFKLAERVLMEDYETSISLIRRIGNTGYPHRADYLHWPLFSELRKTDQFTEAFEEIFGDPSHEHYELREPRYQTGDD